MTAFCWVAGFSQKNTSDVYGTLPKAERVPSCGDGIQLEGCNFTPSGQHRMFNLILKKKQCRIYAFEIWPSKEWSAPYKTEEKNILSSFGEALLR